jgi:pSer/pThr/pTyr-binding forkhead associated (FHA) protein
MNAFDTQPLTPAESAERLRAQQTGRPFLVVRGPGGDQRITILPEPRRTVTIGRREDNDVALPWDPNVSRVHAELHPVGPEWALQDDGLSRNGSYVNAHRVSGRHRLHNLDVIKVGMTALLFRAPLDQVPGTAAGAAPEQPPELTPIQAQVLAALCGPFRTGQPAPIPATNKEIAEQVHLSVDAVKGYLRVLSTKFGVGNLPQNEKRARLAAEAIKRGAAGPRG